MPVPLDGNEVFAWAPAPGSWCVTPHPHTPMRQKLAIRVDAENPDHHLWKNHGTWWIHYTLHLDELRTRRVRFSLATAVLEEARERRDRLFASLGGLAATGGAR